jgi:hypothetical protein
VRLVELARTHVGNAQPLRRHPKLAQREVLRDREVLAVPAVRAQQLQRRRPIVALAPVLFVGDEAHPIEEVVDQGELVALGPLLVLHDQPLRVDHPLTRVRAVALADRVEERAGEARCLRQGYLQTPEQHQPHRGGPRRQGGRAPLECGTREHCCADGHHCEDGHRGGDSSRIAGRVAGGVGGGGGGGGGGAPGRATRVSEASSLATFRLIGACDDRLDPACKVQARRPRRERSSHRLPPPRDDAWRQGLGTE